MQTHEIEVKLTTRVDVAVTLRSEFDFVQTSIEQLQLDDEHQDKHGAKRASFEERYYSLISEAKRMLQISQTSYSNTNVALHPIHVPEFSGSYNKWTAFHDAFKSLIHENKAFANVQYFFYLQSPLKGEAAHLISSMLATDGKYKIAWDLLRSVPKESHLVLSIPGLLSKTLPISKKSG